jgi:hypothetical protein
LIIGDVRDREEANRLPLAGGHCRLCEAGGSSLADRYGHERRIFSVQATCRKM